MFAAVCAFAAVASVASTFGQADAKIMALPGLHAWTGDFDGMRKRRLVRILVPYSRTLFFQDKGTLLGASAEVGLELEKWLNKRYGKKPYDFHVAFVPTRRNQLLQDLRDGKGDIAAANLTVTPERLALVDFVTPWVRGVKEILVTGPSAPAVAKISDLGGRTIDVRKSSSYHTHLLSVNAANATRPSLLIKINFADENLEDEDLMEMVSSGLLPWIFVDSHKTALWAKIYKGLTVHDSIAIHEAGEIAWAIRKDSPQLRKELDEFVAEQVGKPTVPDIWRRYFADGKTVKNVLAKTDIERYRDLLTHFRTYGGMFSIDPNLLAAQGYKESRLDQKLRVKSGAVGVMQIKPSTAREIGIEDVVSRADDNIHAGAKYLRYMADKYIPEQNVDEKNRVLMALAAYNAGPGNLRKFRKSAADRGFDPNVWFGNVETGAAAIVGQETVRYVSQIYKYYVAYSALAQK